jgi:hypothetical protein
LSSGAPPSEAASPSVLRAARGLLLIAAGVLLAALLFLEKPWQAASGPGFVWVEGRTFREAIAIPVWWASLVNLLLLGPLWWTLGWWLRPGELPQRPVRRIGRRVLALLLLAMTLCLAVRLPLAERSLWWDEGWSISRVLVGYAEPDPLKPGELLHERPHWGRLLWYYAKPTNHNLYNATAAVGLAGWRAATEPASHEFDDLVFRWPALAASALTVLLLGLLLTRAGYARAGVTAAFLLALNPWHIRYGVEGRAYTFLALLSVAAALALCEALRGGRWRAWLALGALQLLLLWNQPVALYLTASLGMLAMVGIAGMPLPAAARGIQLRRLFLANGLAAMVFLQMMAPNLGQSLAWDDVVQDGPKVDLRTAANLFSLSATGSVLRERREGRDTGEWTSWAERAAAAPWSPAWTLWGLAGLAVIGLLRGIRGSRELGLALLASLLAALLLMGVSRLGNFYYYPRFQIYQAVTVAGLLALGIDGVLSGCFRAGAGRRRGLVAIGLGAWLVGVQPLLIGPEFRILQTRPIAPLRDVGEFLRALSGPDPTAVVRVGYGLGGKIVRIYDPWVRPVVGAPGIATECRAALAERRPFYVFYGYPRQNRRKRADGFELLDDPQRFQEVARFVGVEPQFTFTVLRFVGVAAQCGEAPPN